MTLPPIPTSWTWTSLESLVGEGAPIVYGIIQAGPEFPDGIRYVRPTELVNGGIDIANLKRTAPAIAERYGRSCLKAGDIILAIVGTIGKLAIVPPELEGANITQSSARIRAPEFMLNKYLAAALMSPQIQRQFDEMEFGVAVRRLNLSHVRALKVPVPPVNEHRRIVEKLDALQAQSRRAREALDEVPGLLEKLRQSILAAAFRGDLTRDWRAKNPDVEPAEKLLQRIRTERRKKWEESELARLTAKGKPPTDDRWKETHNEPERAHGRSLPPLAPGWCWAALGELGADPLNPVQTGPFGAMLHNTDFVPDGVPVIAVGNLTGLGFRTAGLYFITQEKARALHRFDVQSGDILFARSGATLGKVCVAPDYVHSWRMTGHILRARLNTTFVRPQMVAWAIGGAGPVREQVMGKVRGATRPGYNTALLESIHVPVPPLGEQDALIAAVENALGVVDRLSAMASESHSQLARLGQSLLAKAFRGELVPQDPNDEPASVMLARLKATAAGSAAASPAKRKPRARKA